MTTDWKDVQPIMTTNGRRPGPHWTSDWRACTVWFKSKRVRVCRLTYPKNPAIFWVSWFDAVWLSLSTLNMWRVCFLTNLCLLVKIFVSPWWIQTHFFAVTYVRLSAFCLKMLIRRFFKYRQSLFASRVSTKVFMSSLLILNVHYLPNTEIKKIEINCDDRSSVP